eukprot:scaffold175492_cov35-Tisochrysis_lutea.AAC.1
MSIVLNYRYRTVRHPGRALLASPGQLGSAAAWRSNLCDKLALSGSRTTHLGVAREKRRAGRSMELVLPVPHEA